MHTRTTLHPIEQWVLQLKLSNADRVLGTLKPEQLDAAMEIQHALQQRGLSATDIQRLQNRKPSGSTT